MNVGNEIKKLRLEKGLTQEQFAEIAGVLKQSVSLWELGKSQPSIIAVNKLSEAFGLDRDVLLNVEEIGPHWVSVKERLPKESKPYFCFGIRADGSGGFMEWTDILDFHGVEQGELIHNEFTWGRAENMIVTHWLEGLEMPDMEGVL